MPDADSMTLFGPGVIDEANANPTSGSKSLIASTSDFSSRYARVVYWYRFR
jgi:hypothetical protein